MQTFTQEQLAEYNGRDGNPAYIAYGGRVYDVGGSRMWKGGRHMNRHSAGTDLSSALQAAPHDTGVLERYPQVGVLKSGQETGGSVPGRLAWLLSANPFFRRHPHPMTVHFPIVLLLAAPFFNFLFLVTGNRDFETTSFHCLGGGILFTAVAMATGFFTWWYNYMAKKMKPVTIKIILSSCILVISSVMFAWRWNMPGVMEDLHGGNILYFVLSLTLLPLISIVGWYGATLTFPLDE